MSREFLGAGIDFTTDTFTDDEKTRTLAWYREHHDVGDLDLSPFARFAIEHDPAWFKRLRRHIFTFEELVKILRHAMGVHPVVLHMPPALAMIGATVAGRLTGDMMLTRDELDDLMHDILISHEPPRGHTHLTDWLRTNAGTVGRAYASEVVRHHQRPRKPTSEAA